MVYGEGCLQVIGGSLFSWPVERLHTTRWNVSTLRGGTPPHYAMERLHTTRWKLSTLCGGSSPHYAEEAAP
ncbi:MAG: hypothetical protein LBB43_02125 [Spirochaetaceae bacterium]|nr:hypothetical protein [Spirochaetaceae bacterium]